MTNYSAAVEKLLGSLPYELVNIIIEDIVRYNFRVFIESLKIDFPQFQDWLTNSNSMVVGKCLLNCLMNKVPTNITIIIPLKDREEIEKFDSSFEKIIYHSSRGHFWKTLWNDPMYTNYYRYNHCINIW